MNLDFLYETRKEIEQRLFDGMMLTMTLEQFQRAKEFISALSDQEFYQFVIEAALHSEKSASIENYRDFLNTAQKAQCTMGVTPQNSALNIMPTLVLPKEKADILWKKISAHRPHDVIRIAHDEDNELMQLWKSGCGKNKGNFIPSDIFFAETVPLKDCVIEIDERDLPNGHIVKCRVVIFDYEEELKNADFDTTVLVGAFVTDYGPGYICMPLEVVRGVDGVVGGGVCFHGLPDDFPKFFAKNVSQQDILSLCASFLDTWYGIQIALLHPTVKSVFRSSRKPEEPHAAGNSKPSKHKVKYIKYYVINLGELENAMYGDKKTINRHALIWYVVGHWRVYESGKKVFIKPYWKGALRDLKTAAEMRTREIVTGGTYNA